MSLLPYLSLIKWSIRLPDLSAVLSLPNILVLTQVFVLRFAFVDFTSIEHATAALINPRNHQMDGRKLVVEYASAEAVRRGGGPHAKTAGTQRGPSKPVRPSRRDQPTPRHEFDRPTVSNSNDRKHSLEHAEEQAPKKPRTETGEKVYRTSGKRERVRPKPGAALALAKRESAAIIPSQGKKIVF